MSQPVISCIMPAYNVAAFIRSAIESILNQTFKDFELIIINDGSTDDTAQIIRSYTDKRIVYLENDVNLKLIKTLNRGIDASRGRYISRLDSDDIALPTLFEDELKEFELHPDAGIINTLTYHMNEQGGGIRPNRKFFKVSPEVMSVITFYTNMISHPGVMVKSDLMKQYHYLDSPKVVHFEDAELWARMFADGIRCYTMNKRLVYYRQSAGSINSLYHEERNERRQQFAIEYCERRWSYTWKKLPKEDTFGNLCIHWNALTKLRRHLLKKKHITFSAAIKLMFWQIRYFIGLSKGVLYK